MDVLGLESFLGARVDLLLCKYLKTPLCEKVRGLVIKVSMTLYFKNVIWGVYCIARCHVGVRVACRFLFFVVPLSMLMCEVIVL